MSDDMIGAPLPRVDGPLKVTGAARFTAEIPLQQVTYGVMVPATIARGQVTAIDDRAARSAPGVLAVITHANAPKLNRPKYLPAGQSMPILQGTEIYYWGQPVAVVVADTFEHATHAASLIRATYHEQAPAAEMAHHLNNAFQPEKMQIGQPAKSGRGNASQGMQQAAVTHTATYSTPFEHHNPMEPHASIAAWEGNRLTVYDSTQGVNNVRHALSQILGIPAKNVRVISHFCGGGFGCKGQSWPHTTLAAVAARQVGRPVKLVLTRPQMFYSNGHRGVTLQTVELGATRDGKLTATRHTIINSTSVLDNFVEPSGTITQFLYACPNVDVEQKLVRLNTGTPTFTRAPGFSSGSYALESAMDEMAYKLGLDPIDFRLRNYAEYDEHENRPWSSKSLRQCYEQGAAHFGWHRRNPRPASMRDGRYLIGYGMASAAYPAHFQPAAARAIMAADGSVRVQCATQEIGTGTYTVMAQVAAKALGISPAQVRLDLGDTNLPPAPASTGSNTVASAGSAVHNAALALRAKLIQMAVRDPRSPLHGVPADAIISTDGRLQAREQPGKSESYTQLLKRQQLQTVSADAIASPGPEQGHDKPSQPGGPPQGGQNVTGQHSYQSFGAQFCEVRVDPLLGEVRVARMTGCFAGGRVLNARTAKSQLMGGMVWGIGMALTEQNHPDPHRAWFTNPDLSEYLVPVHADVPPIDVLLVEEYDPYVNPIGAKGLGEIGIVGAAAAIANAVYHATGKRIRDLPITPARLMV